MAQKVLFVYELILTITREIFIFRSFFKAIIDQHEIFDKKLPNLITLKYSCVISVPDGYIAGVVYEIYLEKYYF